MAADNSRIQELILKALAETGGFEDGAVLKGGGALRHVYGSPRFSADLDLSWPAGNPEKAETVATRSCRLIRNVLGSPFGTDKVYHTSGKCIRVILSEKRPDRSKNKVFIEIDDLPNPESAMHALAVAGMPILRVRTLRQMANDKFLAILARRRPKGRDFFDVGFLKYRDIEAPEVSRALREYRSRGLVLDVGRCYARLEERLADPDTRRQIKRDILEYMHPEETKTWPGEFFGSLCSRALEWVKQNLERLGTDP